MKEPLVHLLGNFQGMSGYSQHTIHFQRALAQQCRCLATDPNWPAQQNAETLRQLQEASQRGESVVNIALFSLDHAHLLAPFPGWKIGFAVWESTVVEESWMQASRTLDGVWTATQWNRQVFIHNGMEPAKVQVVPEGVDPDLFSPAGDLFSQLQQDNRYKFLIVGKFEERKKTAAMIRAFDDVFHGQQDVMLLLLCHNHFVPNFNINKELQKLSLKNKNNIAAGAWVPTSDILAKIYRSCNVFLAASRAEGWGLPICEAMACGLPTIVTHYSGPTEFVHGDNALLLDYTLTPIPAN
ncbi:MAG: glycosyltransferase family 4 protein, partial [Magnetococcales bacterium]|nr:glycosyltransferase family 4 protein [Magnetococcales bacterium]